MARLLLLTKIGCSDASGNSGILSLFIYWKSTDFLDIVMRETYSLIKINNPEFSLTGKGNIRGLYYRYTYLNVSMCNTDRFQVLQSLNELKEHIVNKTFFLGLEKYIFDSLKTALFTGLEKQVNGVIFCDDILDKF